MVERIIFNVLAFALFVIIFMKMIQRNDTNYIYILAIQALGMFMGFIGLLGGFTLPITILIITYLFCIIIPLAVIFMEKKGLLFSEFFYTSVAQFCLSTGKQEEAKKIILKLIDKIPNSYLGHKKLAQMYEKEEKKETAIEEYVRALEINHKDDNAYFKVAQLLVETDKKQEASKMLTDLLKKKPDQIEASLLLGDILYEQENFKEAISIYLDALKYHPEEYDLYYNLGMTYTRLNDFQSAKEYYEKAAKLNSMLYHAQYSLGQIALIFNDLEEAQQYFMQALNDGELEADSYYSLAYIAMLKGDAPKAITYLNEAIEEKPQIYEKIKKETLFQYILKQINKPTNEKKKEKTKEETLTKKERQTLYHLENTNALVGNLNHHDVKAIRKMKEKNKEQKERGIE
ncbi:MAG: tetratricopeptide repeat protein [Clostridia bacterium]